FFTALFISIGYLVQWVRKKEWKHLVISFVLPVVGGLIGIANSAVSLLTNSEYAKYTMRGGKTIETQGEEIKTVNTSGLDRDYAFSYSIGKSETLTLFMPGVFGEGTGTHFDENAKLVQNLVEKNVPESQAIQIAQN